MDRRESKYHGGESLPVKSRVSNNENLYDELNNKIVYEEIVEMKTDTPIDLSMLDGQKKSRENYNRIKEYHELIMPNTNRNLSDTISKEELLSETKNFDINAILEEAKRNRNCVDELECKRNLKDDEISVLSSLNKKYLHKKDMSDKDTEELKDLINTITSNSLLSTNTVSNTSDDKDLLSDLMTQSVETFVANEETSKDILNEDNASNDEGSTSVNTFYTKSMEIKNEDLEDDNIKETDVVPKKKRVFTIIFIVIMIIITLLVSVYFIIGQFGIELF